MRLLSGKKRSFIDSSNYRSEEKMAKIYYSADNSWLIGVTDRVQGNRLVLLPTSTDNLYTEWDFQPDGGITLHSDPTLAIDCGTVSAEQYLYLNTYKKNNASASQQWQFDPQSDDAQSGYIENVGNSQLVFDLQWRNVAKGTYIWTFTANASDAEIWSPVPVPQDSFKK
ncbi:MULTISPECIES: hypothetical protein [unclassified Burkholderia]|uniref:RICIN domain-containing protein n=1 Tax=unclassified Burkholderia TaxID=2613784 RepID=UPI00117D10FC|nr:MULTISPECIES: hypothetical protein [unclassified Burkholderia]MBN3731187.1 hypothetical protein [Burkholderia sp. Tr-20390]